MLIGCSESSGGLTSVPILPPYIHETTFTVDKNHPVISCNVIPALPMKNLIFESVYKKSDPYRAEISKKKEKDYLEKTKGLRKFENRLISLSNAYLKSGGKDYESAYCALNWLYEWASKKAFLGRTNQQGDYLKQWSLATFSSAYTQIHDAPGLDQAKKKTVEKWLKKLARDVMAEYSGPIASISKNNNHSNWAAWAVTATGVAVSNKDLYDWGLNRARISIQTQIQADGSLPLEMGRGKKALQYHIFALAPLIMVAETARNNGEDLYAEDSGILHKLVRRTFDGIKDPSWFNQKSEFTQENIQEMSEEHFSWVEVYNARFPDAAIEVWLKAYRPIFSRRTGGDMTFLYYKGVI